MHDRLRVYSPGKVGQNRYAYSLHTPLEIAVYRPRPKDAKMLRYQGQEGPSESPSSTCQSSGNRPAMRSVPSGPQWGAVGSLWILDHICRMYPCMGSCVYIYGSRVEPTSDRYNIQSVFATSMVAFWSLLFVLSCRLAIASPVGIESRQTGALTYSLKSPSNAPGTILTDSAPLGLS
jgi:hypothetical protein